MKKIIACVDGSAHAESVMTMAGWAAERTGADVALLHVVAPHTDAAAPTDFSGAIGLGAKSELLEELAKIDEEHGRLEQKKGQLILKHAQAQLANSNAGTVSLLHRRGDLAEEVSALEAEADLIVVGKRGELSDTEHGALGANLEQVSRAVEKPLLVATQQSKPVERFLIAYDGRTNSDKAVDFVVQNPLLKGLECHLLKVGAENSLSGGILGKAETKLKEAGFSVTSTIKDSASVDAAVANYMDANAIDLLLMGAYGHSPLRRFFLGSTTMAQVGRSKVPVLLFR